MAKLLNALGDRGDIPGFKREIILAHEPVGRKDMGPAPKCPGAHKLVRRECLTDVSPVGKVDDAENGLRCLLHH
jgi:hypothetical protein